MLGKVAGGNWIKAESGAATSSSSNCCFRRRNNSASNQADINTEPKPASLRAVGSFGAKLFSRPHSPPATSSCRCANWAWASLR